MTAPIVSIQSTETTENKARAAAVRVAAPTAESARSTLAQQFRQLDDIGCYPPRFFFGHEIGGHASGYDIFNV